MKKYYIADPLDTRWNKVNFQNEFGFEGKTYVSSEDKIDFAEPVEIPQGYYDMLEKEKERAKMEFADKKKQRILDLNTNMNAAYEAYLAKYPDVEVRTFEEKAKESFLVKKNPKTSLDDTPLLCKLTANGTIEERNILAGQVFDKVVENATLEKWGVATRDAIKAAENEEVLNKISVAIPNLGA